MKKAILVFLTLTISFSTIHAQEVIPATGGNATGSGGSVSYTIGQTFYSTNSGTNGSVAEGVQQPYEIYHTPPGIKKAKDISLSCTAYPNPTMDFLTLKVENYKISKLYYQLYDLNGKLLENKKITTNETIISVSNLPSGTYLLQIAKLKSLSKTDIKTFKIVKNH